MEHYPLQILANIVALRTLLLIIPNISVAVASNPFLRFAALKFFRRCLSYFLLYPE